MIEQLSIFAGHTYYIVVDGYGGDMGNYILDVTQVDCPTACVVECPPDGIDEGEYLTVFGQYVIKPQLLVYLEEQIRNNVREGGEFQLTSALDRLRQEDGVQGLTIQGQRFDIGLPDHYVEALQTFRRN